MNHYLVWKARSQKWWRRTNSGTHNLARNYVSPDITWSANWSGTSPAHLICSRSLWLSLSLSLVSLFPLISVSVCLTLFILSFFFSWVWTAAYWMTSLLHQASSTWPHWFVLQWLPNPQTGHGESEHGELGITDKKSCGNYTCACISDVLIYTLNSKFMNSNFFHSVLFSRI